MEGESVEVKGEMAAGLEIEDVIVEVRDENESAEMAAGAVGVVGGVGLEINSQVSDSQLPALSALPVYKERDKTLCDFCGKGYAKTGIARHRKLCLNKNKNEVKEDTQPAAPTSLSVVSVVPVSQEESQPAEPPPPQPPAPPSRTSARRADRNAPDALRSADSVRSAPRHWWRGSC